MASDGTKRYHGEAELEKYHGSGLRPHSSREHLASQSSSCGSHSCDRRNSLLMTPRATRGLHSSVPPKTIRFDARSNAINKMTKHIKRVNIMEMCTQLPTVQLQQTEQH